MGTALFRHTLTFLLFFFKKKKRKRKRDQGSQLGGSVPQKVTWHSDITQKTIGKEVQHVQESERKAETQARWPDTSFKRVFCFDHMLLDRKPSTSVIFSPETSTKFSGDRQLSLQVPSTVRHHARSQISEVQLELSSGRGSRAVAAGTNSSRSKSGKHTVSRCSRCGGF